jgi:maleylacetoacetate isomerase
MKLYTYFRSSAAYRVRIALALKGLSWTPEPVHMLRGGGEQHASKYGAIHPQRLVPVLEDEGHLFIQSMAICEYLDERYPAPPLLPGDPVARAYVRSIANAVACEVHPLNNLRVLQYITRTLRHSEEEKTGWIRHWIEEGFSALETYIVHSKLSGHFAFGDTPGLADAFLVPQIYNARRFNCDMSRYPTLMRIDKHCNERKEFGVAHPDAQVDAGAA